MKTIFSARNPLTKEELKRYQIELCFLKWVREDINEEIGKKYNRAYTEPQAGGKCRMKLYGMKKKWMNKIFKQFGKHSSQFTVEKHCEKRWYGKVYSIVLRAN